MTGPLVSYWSLPLLLAAAMGVASCGSAVPPAQAVTPAIEGRQMLAPAELALAKAHAILPPSTRSLLDEDAMRHGQFAWNEDGVPEGPVTVWVDVRRQMVSVFRAGHEIGTAVILYGAPGNETPLGTFPILRKIEDYHSRTYDAPMPHSLFLTADGVALHGSKVRPRRATHGCIGLPEEFARKLFAATEVGGEVTIVRSTPLDPARLAATQA